MILWQVNISIGGASRHHGHHVPPDVMQCTENSTTFLCVCVWFSAKHVLIMKEDEIECSQGSPYRL